MLSPQLLTELKQIVKEEYNVILTDQEVSQLGNFLIDSYDILTSGDQKEEES